MPKGKAKRKPEKAKAPPQKRQAAPAPSLASKLAAKVGMPREEAAAKATPADWKPTTKQPHSPIAAPAAGWKMVSQPSSLPVEPEAWKPLEESTAGAAARKPQESSGGGLKGLMTPRRGKGKAAKGAAAPPVPADGPARAIHRGDPTKQDLQLTRPQADKRSLHERAEEEVARDAVVKTVEWETPKPTTPPTPPSGWVPLSPPPVQAAAARVLHPTLEPPKPAGRGAPKEGAQAGTELGSMGVKLPPGRPIPPEFIDPEDLFPITADDVMIDFYPIHEPYAYVMITYSNHDKELVYRVIEPRLSADERRVLDFVESTMVDMLDAPPEQLQAKGLAEFLRAKFDEVLYDYSIFLGEDDAQEQASKARLLYYLDRDFIGEGRIDAFMRDDLIEDISCDGAHQPVFIYHRKYESFKTNVKFRSDDELDSFVIRMAQRAGKHVSIADPILDATMRDGSRLQATLAREVSAHGSSFTIRKFRQEPFTPPDLVRFGTQSAEILAYWWIAIQHGASAIYAGGTASGKTTSLNAILLFIPYQMKIVSIEDTRELSIPHPNWIAGITRPGFGPRDREGRQAGEIDMFQLLKNALRQRPEYIVVGEVRGKEAYNLFQAMATGHAAYGTMHADSVDSVIHRLESDPINIPRSLLEALDIISIQIQTRVGGKRVRRTKQVAEIVGLDPHTREILTNEVFRWVPKDDSFKFSGVSYVLERIQVEKGMTPQQMKQEIENRVEVIKYTIRHNIRNYRDCARVIAAYYKDPASVMAKVQADEPWK